MKKVSEKKKKKSTGKQKEKPGLLAHEKSQQIAKSQGGKRFRYNKSALE